MTDETIRLRFVHGNAISSGLIELRSGMCSPFPPSHVEAVYMDKYIGQHMDGGMQSRDPGYDKAAPVDEFFVDLPCSSDQRRDFYKYVVDSIGEPYDWEAIFGFALSPQLHFHLADHSICSAKMFLGLRKVSWFQSPVAVPAHVINPRDLLLMISCVTPIKFERNLP
jgi:hypothetical protein